MGLKPVKVGQLNSYIGRILRTDPILGNVSVVGEISNLKFHGSGHVYFTLKDETGKINCFLAAGNMQYINCPLDEGMEVIASGYVSVYERGGTYSLNVRGIEVNGTGQLAVQFEKLKQKLEKEGLFDKSHKKPLPFFASKIAVVTSETGAAIRDIIRTIQNKNNHVDILMVPVLVQGPGAPADIARAIDQVNAQCPETDVIIVGRGGGSMEELWAFNEEVVARSIYRSVIPVISAVGHENDFTIADFVADYRAATPTAAAEAAAVDTDELGRQLDAHLELMKKNLRLYVEMRRNRLELRNPEAFALSLKNKVAFEQMNAENIMDSMTDNIRNRLSSARNQADMLNEIVKASSPDSILARGYSIVTDKDGTIIRSADQLEIDQDINIRTGSGLVEANVRSITKE